MSARDAEEREVGIADSAPAPAGHGLAPPSWIEVRHGGTPLLLFAPHGGRRSTPRRPGRDKVNDLHTADLTRELGVACDAASIINAHRDRNEVDLNRTEQLQRRAPWLLHLLAATLEEMVARYGRATLLAVHGWNVVQPVCDVGIGLVEEAGGACRRAAQGEPTVSRQFLDGTLRALQRRAAEDRIAVTIGVRYPAAHPSNVMQLFTSARASDPDPLLRRLAALADRVDAAQLELGIPLRWAGARRDAFLRTLVEVFSAAQPARQPRPPGPIAALACGGRPTTRVALQLATESLAVLTSIDVAPAGAIAGRLLVSDTPDRLALFTGELAERGSLALHVPALRVVSRGPHAFDVRFAGPVLSFPMLTPFADLERGLAAGTLVEARVDLRFTPAHPLTTVERGGARFGRVEGMIQLGESRHEVATRAHAHEDLGGGGGYPSARLVLPGTALGDVEVRSRGGDTGANEARSDGASRFHFAIAGVAWHGAESLAVHGSARVTITAPATVRLQLESGAGETHAFDAVLERLIPVRRPGPRGSVIETVFALCRPPAGPTGWLELTVEHPPEHGD